MAKKKEMALVVPDNIMEIATKEGLKPFLDMAKAVAVEAAKEVNDASTEDGRKAINALGKKVSSSKTAISKPGAAMVKSLKKQGVDAQKLFKSFEDEMDIIRNEILKPVIELKAAEKAAENALKERVDEVNKFNSRFDEEGKTKPSKLLISQRAILRSMKFTDEEFGFMAAEANMKLQQALQLMNEMIVDQQKIEDVEAENQALKAEMAEKDKANEIEKAVMRGEQDAIAAHEKKIAEAEAKIKIKEILAKARSEDVEHRRAINAQSVVELTEFMTGMTEDYATLLITAIAKNKFTHITINY